MLSQPMWLRKQTITAVKTFAELCGKKWKYDLLKRQVKEIK